MRTDPVHKPVIVVILSAVVFAGVALTSPGAARADDDDDSTSTESTAAAAKTQWGVGFRLRNVLAPKGLLELFVEQAPAGISTVGYGFEITRRKGNMELILGLEYEQLIPKGGEPSNCAANPSQCIWIDKGDSIPADAPDLVEFDKFGWFTIDFTFAWRNEINKMFAIRYGAGIGLGIVTGSILRTDYVCSTSDVSSCTQDPNAENLRTKEDGVPPVFPVINAMVGLQITPIEQVSINVEAGIRTFPYFGASANYFF